MTRVRRSFLNYLFTMFFVGITAITGFLTTPLLIRLLGGEKLGASRALVEWLGMIGLLELGLSTALQGELAQALGKSDPGRLRGVLWAGFRAFAAVGVVMLVCALAFAGLARYLIRVGPENTQDLCWAVIVAASGFLVYPVFVLRALAEAQGRAYILQSILIVQSLLIAGFSLLFAYFNAGITGQALAALLAMGVMVTSLGVLYRNDIVAACSAGRAEVKEAGQRLWRMNRTAALWGLCGRFQLTGALLLVAAIYSSDLVLDVSVSQRIVFTFGTTVLAVSGSTWAVVSEAHHEQAGAAVSPLLILSGLASTLAAGVLVPLVAINRSFVEFWVGGDHYIGESFSALTATGLFLYSLFNLWAMPLIGVGGLRRLAPPLTVVTLGGVVVGVPITWLYGPVGAVAVVNGVMLFMLAGPVPLLLRELLGVPLRCLLSRIFTPWLVAAVPAFTLFAAMHWRNPKNLMEAGALCAVYAGVFAILAWLFVLASNERTSLLLRAGLRTVAHEEGHQ